MVGGLGRDRTWIAAALVAAALACQDRTARTPREDGPATPAVQAAPLHPALAPERATAPSDDAGPLAEPAEADGQEETASPPEAAEAAEPAGAEPRPAPPVRIAASATSETEVELRWAVPAGERDAAAFEVLRGGSVIATTSTAAAREGGLSPWTRYCYTVRSVARDGRRSSPSARACASTPDRTPPEPPAGLAAAAASEREIALRWSAARDLAGVARYEVLAGSAVVSTTGATAARVAGLSPGREYCYAVVALDGAGNRSAPARACATTLDVTPPTEPGALSATATSETHMELRWTEATDEAGVAGYRVLRGGAVVATVEVTGAGDDGLNAARSYCYTVVAFDAAGNVSRPAGPVCATTLDLTPPTAPVRPVATAASEDRVEIRWGPSEDNVGVASYQVRRAAAVRVHEDGLSASESGLRPYTEYCYAVVAVDAAGNRSAPARPACARTLDVTAPSAPADVVVRPAAQARLEVRWSASTDNHKVAGYELLRGGEVVSSVAGGPAAETQLAPSTEYCYEVRAYDHAGNRSGVSGRACGTTLALDQPSPPRNVAVQRTPGAIRVRWESEPRPDVVYRIYEEGRPIGATRFLGYAVRRTPDGKRRCYTVEAVSDAGRESPRSEQACAAFLPETSAAM